MTNEDESNGMSATNRQYPAPVNTEQGRESTRYRRARRDLAGALDDLIERGQRLAEADADVIVEEARRMRADSIDVVTYAVLALRARGDSWGSIASRLGLDDLFVREHYEPIERRWAAGHGIGPFLPSGPAGTTPLRVVSGGE